MPNNIYAELEQLGLTAQKRAIHVQLSNGTLNDQVFLQRIEGTHELNKGIYLQLICLSTSANIPLKQFIGAQTAIDIVNDKSELNRISGIVTKADIGASDGSLTIYRLIVEDPTALWKHRRNSRVFMNKSVVDVVQTIFSEWQQKSPLFASSLTLDKSGLTKDYDIRPFIMQMNERDIDFVQRLLASEGINWLIDEAQLKVSSSSEQIQPQKLRLIDDNAQYKALDRRNIRFHRSSAVEQTDSITNFIGRRSIQPTAVHIQRWQADALETEEGAGSVQSKHSHSENQDNVSLGLEQAWHFSPAWIQDLKGEDGATKSGNSQIEKFNENLSNYYDSQAKQFTATSTVRDAQVGYWFEFNEHPEIDEHDGADKEFLITAKSFYNQNNLPKDLTDQVTALLKQSNWQQFDIQTNNQDERQANNLVLQRRNIATVPEYNPLTQRPTVHPMRAKVVGLSGEEIHVDEWGRIKVRFLFTRNEDNTHDGGAGSNDNDTDSAWVDVLTPWAGEGYGARFLPRVNEIVVIDFFDGNIDRPFVVGRIHEAQRHPTKFDNKGKLPDTKKLAGIRSKEVKGEGFGQLRFDDTTGQISTQLQSSHGATQLNLGKLSHPKDKAESEDRGEGFELRTDQWGAVRAGQGLLISSENQSNASDIQLNIKGLLTQISESLDQLKTLEKNARTSKAFQDENYQISEDIAKQVETTLAKFEEPHILMSSSKDIISVSQQNQTHVAKENIKIISGKQLDLSSSGELTAHAVKGLSIYTQENGINAIATQGQIKIHAQNDELDVASLKDCKIMSTENAVTIVAKKEIMLTCGGGYIKIKTDGSIEINSPGLIEVKSGQTKFTGGTRHNFQIPNISSKICIPCLLDAARKSLPFVHREI
ncbi:MULTISPECIES: type VI secretion system Vgr family protein [unclassified Acinetobacter]|uniref:type VI secretion system Vgr family protein n=1 Tax=unclassified Acinetobacter TaxID=196816 RepID=UPI0015D32F09|nr:MULTISPECIES: type VI secretion system Vgr family protein [unclassified Acinetobacter]UUS56567.1 type VI secretion system tip protein VgrG [Acinetobacter sp. YH16040_T]